MTVLAVTAHHLVEYDEGTLTIARYADGHCVALTGRGIAGTFRDCLRTHTAERTVECFIRMATAPHRRMIARPGYRSPFGCSDNRDAEGWQPLYKPHRMPMKDVARALFVERLTA